VWPIQEGTNLTQKEVTTLEEVGFSFDYMHRNIAQSLFGFKSFSSSNSHVPTVSCHSRVKSFDASCWLYNPWWQEGETTFYVQNNTTHQQLGNWHDISLMHCFPHY